MTNAFYGKTIENVAQRIDKRLLNAMTKVRRLGKRCTAWI